MSNFISLNMVDGRGTARFNEDTGRDEATETSKPVVINAETIRCFYARRDGKPGTRITFNDGGGFVVTEAPQAVAQAVAAGEAVVLALSPPATEAAN
jgi:hypothetical protein